MENPIKMDDLGVPPLSETLISIKTRFTVQVLFGGHQQGLPMVGIHANASQLEVGFFQKIFWWKFFQAKKGGHVL